MRRTIIRGAAIGGTAAILLLILSAFLVMIGATMSVVHPDGAADPARGITTFLFGAVCFGLPFVILCTLLGAIIGLFRARM